MSEYIKFYLNYNNSVSKRIFTNMICSCSKNNIKIKTEI